MPGSGSSGIGMGDSEEWKRNAMGDNNRKDHDNMYSFNKN